MGPSRARMALSRVARQRMVGSAITATTPESRTDKYKGTCTARSERKGLNCCPVHLNADSICSLAHVSVFCSLWQFRVQTVATAMNATGCVQITPHRTHAHLFSLRTPAPARCEYTFGSRASRFVCVLQKSISLVMSLLNVPSTPFLFIFLSLTALLTTPTASPTPLTEIRLPLCNSALGWTV